MTPVSPPRPPSGRGLRLGPLRITPLLVIVTLLFPVSLAVIGWAILQVKDEGQVTLLELGTIGLAVAFGLVALACLRGMWRAASMARSGRALGLAIVGGLAGLGAIGSLTATLILALLWGG